MEHLTYKGYISSIRFSAEDRVFWGKVENIEGLITFEADTAAAFEANFHKAIDDYLEDCRKMAIPPQPPMRKRKGVRISQRPQPVTAVVQR